MQLSRNFTLAEFTRSDTAQQLGIDNRPNRREIAAMRSLCLNLLQPLRDYFSAPLIISSGYRCGRLNRAVGGAMHSQHKKGEAVDFNIQTMTAAELFNWLVFYGQHDLIYDQCIFEYGQRSTWVHLSYTERRSNRMEARRLIRPRYGKLQFPLVQSPMEI